MIKGTYIFYEDGNEIYRSSNIITKFGKRFFTNLIAGTIAEKSSADIAIGIDSTSATENDTRLGFEFYRLPILFGSTDIQTDELGVSTYAVVYKTTLLQSISGIISEVGLYPSTRTTVSNYDSKFLTDFGNRLNWYDQTGVTNPATSTIGAKISDTVITMSSNGTSAREYTSTIEQIDMDGYSIADTVKLAYYKNDTNLQSIRLKFYSSDTAYYYVDITPDSGTGYKMSSSISMSTFLSNSSGGPDISNINKIGVVITPTSGNTTSVGIDGLRVNDEDIFDPIFGLISRSILSTPLIKLAGRQVDLEYRLDLTF